MSYSLPADQNSGTVAGVHVSYNAQTWQNVRNIGNATLKRLLEEFAVRAALERGFSSVMIVSIFHSTTIDSRGRKVPSPMHCTIHAGTAQLKAHIEVAGFNPTSAPAHWYDGLRVTTIKWSDRATSSNDSSSHGGSQGGVTPPQAGHGHGGATHQQAGQAHGSGTHQQAGHTHGSGTQQQAGHAHGSGTHQQAGHTHGSGTQQQAGQAHGSSTHHQAGHR